MNNILKKTCVFLMFICLITFSFGCFDIQFDDSEKDIELDLIISGDDKVAVGSTIILNAEVQISGLSQNVIWHSMNENIAIVSSTGVVTGVNVGSTIIVATSVDDSTVIGKFRIKVIKEDIISTNQAPTKIELYGNTIGTEGELIVLNYKVSPANASDDFIWASSNEEVAKVEGKGIVMLISPGNATITCTSTLDDSIQGNIIINCVQRNNNYNYEQSVIDCIENTKNSILGVANYYLSKDLNFVKSSIGSGFVYKVEEANGEYYHYLITNRHVVENADKLTVYLHFIDEEVDAELLGYDSKVDLAVIAFYYNEKIEPLKFYNSDLLKAGQTVVAIGNPEGFEFSSSATLGIISYPLRYVSEDTDDDNINDWDAAYIQHDAAINPGNSGGPLINLYGEVIGINTMKFSATEIDNMGFSIPTKTICELLPYLEKGDTPKRATIGIQVIAIRDLLSADLTNSDYEYKIPDVIKTGLYINGVTSGSVADIGGIKNDDILMKFNNVELKSSLELRAELNKIIVGSNTKIEVVVYRNNEYVTLTLIF